MPSIILIFLCKNPSKLQKNFLQKKHKKQKEVRELTKSHFLLHRIFFAFKNGYFK